MPHCHCAKTMLGTLKVNPHCAVHGTEYDLGASRVSQMGLTSNEKNVLNQVSKELNKASKMHKSQADRIRSLGFAPKPKNLVQNYEPTNQDMTWFKGRVKTLHNELHSEKMSQIHNLGSARRVQMIGNIIPNIEGKHVGTMIVAGVVGNTILASRLEKAKWWKNLTRGITITGIPITLAGVAAGAKGIREENTTTMAAGAALSGIGLSFLANTD